MTLPRAPFGYKWEDDALVDCELEQAIIRAIDDLRAKGYTYTSIGRWMAKKGYIEPVEVEQRILENIKKLRESGLTYARIAEELAKRGHLTKRGGRWRADSVKDICERSQDA